MKVKILSIVILLFFMALIPFAAAQCSNAHPKANKTLSTLDTIDNENNSGDYNKILCGLVAAKYRTDYCTETVKALTIILNTNYKFNPDSFCLDDSNVCIFENNADNSLKEVYPQIEKAVNSAKEKTLQKNNTLLYIPYSEISGGTTNKSDEYEYLTAVASPWDCYQKEFDENKECIGVSIEGINYLCKNGMTAEEALIWYLPDFEIK